jgi:hypothetical protein
MWLLLMFLRPRLICRYGCPDEEFGRLAAYA